MQRRFVGRWRDQTASRGLCRPYGVFFASIPLVAVAVFLLLAVEPSLINASCASLSPKLQEALRVFDGIALPRSLSELEVIDERRGSSIFQAAFLAETLFAMVGIIAVALMLKYVDLSKINDDFSFSQFCIRLSVASCFLVFQPPSFSNPSMVMNYVDQSGLFLIREGVVVAIGYHQVALLLVDALGRMKGLRNPALARRLVIPPSYEGTESR